MRFLRRHKAFEDEPARRLFRKSPDLFELAARRVAPATLAAVADALRSAGFDPQSYRRSYPDLDAALSDDDTALAHFVAYCGVDRRPFPITLDATALRTLASVRCAVAIRAKMIMTLVNAFVVPDGGLWTSDAEAQRRFWYDVMAAATVVGEPVVFVGDSHVDGYIRLIERARRPIIPFLVSCTGCSAAGLSNPDARSGAGRRLALLSQSLPEASVVYAKFGQVDVEFVFNFGRIRRGERAFSARSFEAFCRRSVDRYVPFLRETFSRHDVTVLSIFPPALADEEWAAGYTNAQVVSIETEQELDAVIEGVRRLEIPNLADRTAHHDFYNRCLAARAKAAALPFLDDFRPFVSRAGVLDRKFTPLFQGKDHHLEPEPIAPVLKKLIAEHRSRRSRKAGAVHPSDGSGRA